MIDFYTIDAAYLDFLRLIDSKVPNVRYEFHEKFFCGVVLTVGDNVLYYAPVSHFDRSQRTNFPIKDKDEGTIIATVRLCFMVPATYSVVKRVSVRRIYQSDPYYAALVDKEYQYCSKHETKLLKRAQAVYRIGCNKKHALNSYCCDFKKLEEHYRTYDVSCGEQNQK